MAKTLEDLRNKIDAIDNELIEILNERMALIHEIGEIKKSSNTAIYRPEREKNIIDRLHKNHKGLLNRAAIEAIFLEIFFFSIFMQ